MTVHQSITAERVCVAVERQMTSLDDPGFCFCTACGADAHGVDPGADGIECEGCGAMAVQGAENLLLHLG